MRVCVQFFFVLFLLFVGFFFNFLQHTTEAGGSCNYVHPQAVLFGCWMLGQWDSWGGGYITPPSIQHPNNTACVSIYLSYVRYTILVTVQISQWHFSWLLASPLKCQIRQQFAFVWHNALICTGPPSQSCTYCSIMSPRIVFHAITENRTRRKVHFLRLLCSLNLTFQVFVMNI